MNGHTKIGRDNEIYQFASIGEVNQDLKDAGGTYRVEIGDQQLHSPKASPFIVAQSRAVD